MGGDLSGAPLAEVTSSLGLVPEDLQLLHSYIQDDPILSGDACPGLLMGISREIHSHSWFWLHQDVSLVTTRRGTRPGSSWADVLFSILFARVLQRRGDFSEQGLCPSIPWSGRRAPIPFDARRKDQRTAKVQDVVYADDLATCVVSSSADALPRALTSVAGHSLDNLAGHGLRANIGPKKTAALLAPVGRNARQVRHHVFTRCKGRLPRCLGKTLLDFSWMPCPPIDTWARSSPSMALAWPRSVLTCRRLALLLGRGNGLFSVRPISGAAGCAL